MLARALRLTWAFASFFVVQATVWGLAAFPIVLLWSAGLRFVSGNPWVRITSISFMVFPSYMFFALTLMVLSPLALRITRWRTPANTSMRIRDMDWRLLTWARYLAATHLVRVVAGTLFRATPMWTFYMRLNGARIGRRVYVNSLAVIDHNLLEFGEGTVIGADVHLSGHTVEHGVVLTGNVRLGRNVTLGIGSVIAIDVEIGDNAQVGALSFVPKHSRLAADGVYYGIPVHPLSDAPHA